ncbi:hypothetical protein SANTM175S_05755 [Streptomyces antimycoticus]
MAARQSEGQLTHQLVQHLHVVEELPDVLLADHEVGTAQAVQVLLARGEPVAVVGADARAADDGRIGGGLDEQAHALAADGAEAQRHRAVAGVQALQRDAIGVVDQALGLASGAAGEIEAEVEEGLHPAARPAFGDRGGGAEPGGRPRTAPAVTGDERPVLGAQRVGHRHRLPRDVPGGDLQRDAVAVQRRAQALGDELRDALFHGVAVVVHGRPFLLPASGKVRVPFM